MKHMRSAVIMLVLTLAAAFCLSAAAFAGIYFKSGLREIGEEAFAGVTLQKNFLVRSGIETIGSRAFADTGVEMVWLPATLKEIAPDAFDDTATFVCSPNTYAESWCRENNRDWDYIMPTLSTDKEALFYGEDAVLTANYTYKEEATSYIWETRERERYWSVVKGETGPTFTYTNTEDTGYVYFRVSAVCGDVVSKPSKYVRINRYAEKLRFNEKSCEALSGDSVYLAWNNMGSDVQYLLFCSKVDPQNPEKNDWQLLDFFKGGTGRTVYGLEMNTTYRFQLVIQEQEEKTLESEPITITTGDTPTAVQMHEFLVEGNSVHMSWESVYRAVYDIYWGTDPEKLTLFRKNTGGPSYHAYNFPRDKKSYIQVKATIGENEFVFWGPVLEINPTEDGPYFYFESNEVNGDVVNLHWTALPNCSYDVYMKMGDDDHEMKIAENISKNYLDVGDCKPGSTWTFRVEAKWNRWSISTPETRVEIPPLLEVEYRALLIGEVSFPGDSYSHRNYGDVESIANVLQNVKTPGGTFYSVIRRQDLSRQGILNAIKETFGGADENDVSLIFIGTHGNINNVGRLAGYLCTIEEPRKSFGRLLMADFADALKEIKGTKIVWLGSCGSGAAIYDPDHPEEENVADPYIGEYNEDEWDGWPEYDINGFGGLRAGEDLALDVGELRLPDFQVMTAARYRFVSWGSETDDLNYFTEYLCRGVFNPEGGMPADLNDDGLLTQHELFTYIKGCMDDPETGHDQEIQAYPVQSDYVLFMR